MPQVSSINCNICLWEFCILYYGVRPFHSCLYSADFIRELFCTGTTGLDVEFPAYISCSVYATCLAHSVSREQLEVV